MGTLRNTAAILITLIFLTAATALVESKQKTAPLILNPDGAPLNLRLSSTRLYIRVQNHSDKDIKWYKLGCVIKDEGKVKNRCAFETRHTELKAKDNSKGLIYGHSFGVELSGSEFCKQSSASLAVVEVGFTDKSLWKNDDHTEPCATVMLQK
jgi:hypothetical protein